MLSRWTKTRFNFFLKLYSFEEMNFVSYWRPHQGTSLWDIRYVLAMHCNVFVLALVLIFAPKVKEFQHEFLIFITEVSSMLQNFKQFQRSSNTLSSRTQWLTKRLRISNEEIKTAHQIFLLWKKKRQIFVYFTAVVYVSFRSIPYHTKYGDSSVLLLEAPDKKNKGRSQWRKTG